MNGELLRSSEASMPCTPAPTGNDAGRTVVANCAIEKAAVSATSRISSENTSRPGRYMPLL